MQTLKEDIRANIVNAAVEEFFTHGFEKASMRKIARSAGISVSNTYNYYKNKEQLFTEIIDPVYQQVKTIFVSTIDKYSRTVLRDDNIMAFSENIVEMVLNLNEQHRRLIIIMAEKSYGTRFARTKEELIGLVGQHLKTIVSGPEKRAGFNLRFEYILGIIASNYIDGLLSILRDYRDREWAAENIRSLAMYHLNGMKALR